MLPSFLMGVSFHFLFFSFAYSLIDFNSNQSGVQINSYLKVQQQKVMGVKELEAGETHLAAAQWNQFRRKH